MKLSGLVTRMLKLSVRGEPFCELQHSSQAAHKHYIRVELILDVDVALSDGIDDHFLSSLWCQRGSSLPKVERSSHESGDPSPEKNSIWVVVKTTVPFWILSIIRHLVFRGPKRGP